MKVKQSGFNDELPRIKIAPGNGDFEPLEGNIELVLSGYNEDGILEFYEQSKIRVNVSFGNDGISADEAREWRDVLDIAVGLAKKSPYPWTPDNVLSEYKKAWQKSKVREKAE